MDEIYKFRGAIALAVLEYMGCLGRAKVVEELRRAADQIEETGRKAEALGLEKVA